MKFAPHVFLAALGLLLTGCAATNYSAYEGGRVVQGTGGTKKMVDDFDLWSNGSPPRKYQIIGIVEDTRRDTLLGLAGYERALVKQAKAVHGDALIILESRSEIVGYYNSGSTRPATDEGVPYAIGNPADSPDTGIHATPMPTTALRDKITKAAVIKYVD